LWTAYHGGLLLILSRLINSCWFCFKWGLILGAVAFAVVKFYLPGRVDEEIRCHVVQQIAQHYGHFKVAVRSAHLDEDGIEIRGLSISDPTLEGPLGELVHFDEVRLYCATDWQELIHSEPQVSAITIRRPTIRATRLPDGTFSVAKLLPPPKLSDHPPPVTVEDGTIEIVDPQNNPAGIPPLREVNLTLAAPDPSGPDPNARSLEGSLTADYLRRMSVNGVVDSQRQSCSIGGTIEGLDVSPGLRQALPGPWAEKLGVLGELRGQADLGFRAAYDPETESPYRFELSGQLAHGRINDPRLPCPLTDVNAKFRVGNHGFSIDELTAKSGPTTLRLSANHAGLTLGGPLRLSAEIGQLELDHQMLHRVPDQLRGRLEAQWDKYLPAGTIDVVLNLSFDGQSWRPNLEVRCLDVSFWHEKFPYRLSGGKGLLTLKDDRLTADLMAFSGNRPVHVTAEVFNATVAPFGWFVAEGKRIPVDEKLLGAVPPRSQSFVRSLNPGGMIDFYVRTWRDGFGQPLRKRLLLGLSGCRIRYDKFCYPLDNICGTIEMQDDHWTFHDALTAENDTGRITCRGYMTSPEQGHELFLRFTGTGVPLDEELRGALQPNVQRVWDGLRPQGAIDLTADVHYRCAQKNLSVGVTARPQPGCTSIEPVQFPFRMENVQCELIYRDGFARLNGFKAEHGRVKMTATGHCSFLPDGRWDLQLERISVDQLRMDHELIPALPGRLRKAITELNLTGPLYLRGSFGLEGSDVAGEPVISRWNQVIDFSQGSIDCGVKLENLDGSMTLAGGFDGRRFHSLGELAIDSLTYKDCQFTQVKGPLWIDDRQVLLGTQVGQRRNLAAVAAVKQRPRPITARLFGGTVYGDGSIALGPQPRYRLNATLSGADLSRCAQEMMAGRQNLKGNLMARVDLWGTGRSTNDLGGRGIVRLRDADVYELPLMISLLKILSIREPDRTAFSKSDIEFDLRGNYINFNKINFNGDAISLLGKGWMDLDRKIALTFHAMVGRDEIHVPVLREVMGGASRQIMQINVRGDLQHPQTEKVALPFVKEVWEQLQRELLIGPNSQTLFPQARQWMPDVGRKR